MVSAGDWLQAKEMRHAVIRSTLAEIYLLVDNITSTLNRKLPDIVGLKEKKDTSPPLEWLQYVASADWPPSRENPPTKEEEANTAARLILIRDALNEAADPATGASIAFTLLMVGDSASQIDEDADEANPEKRKFSRLNLAEVAFPHLPEKIKPAKRLIFHVIPILMAALLAITILLSYDAARGTALASQFSRLTDVSNQLEDQLAKLQGAEKAQGANPVMLDQRLQSARHDVAVAQTNLEIWCQTNAALYALDNLAALPKANEHYSLFNVQQALIVLGALVNIVLPGLYGMLGAMAGQIRQSLSLIRDNRLLPRHVRMFFTPWLLGSVAGATIGLFFAPASPTGAADGNAVSGLANSLHLSTSAIAFLAGFGVDGVFDTLDSLVRRVFNLAASEKGGKA